MKDTALVRILLDKGADLNCQGKENKVLAYAAGQKNLTMVKYLLENGADAKMNGGKALIQTICPFNDHRLEIVEILVKYGADVNVRFEKYSGSPLHVASKYGLQEIVTFLLDAGANIDDTGSMYDSPLQTAIDSGNVNIAFLLLDCGADVNVIAGFTGCALSLAIKTQTKKCFTPFSRVVQMST